ncbi:YcfA-like protein [Phycisphaerae bacterium RAS2]|nr:YcfA-like protein [Phycisphaerae bacterium RAS2]
MSRLPTLSGRELVSILQRLGYAVVRQRGSHMRLRHPTDPSRKPTTVPDHRELKPGTLHAILRDAALTVEQLREML